MPKKLTGLLLIGFAFLAGMASIYCFRMLKKQMPQANLKLNPDMDPLKLILGKPAAQLTGLDFENQSMSLSDFKGRIIVLDFWGFWAEDTTRKATHYVSLQSRMEGRPFVLLGVNSDVNKEETRIRMANAKMTWRNWCDGKRGGEIQSAWGITKPMNFIIDQKGVVRYANLYGIDLDNAIDRLLNEPQ